MVDQLLQTLDVSRGGLLHRRRVLPTSKSVETPLKAHPIEYTTGRHSIAGEIGAVELYRQVNGQQLLEAANGEKPQFLIELDRNLQKVDNNDALKFIFLEYIDSGELQEWEANTIAKVLERRADFIPMVFLPDAVQGVRDPDRPTRR